MIDIPELLSRHQREWAEHRVEWPVDRMLSSLPAARAAKVAVEALAARQQAERLAAGMDQPCAQQGQQGGTGVVVYLPSNGRAPVDYARLSDETLEAIIAAAGPEPTVTR